MSDRVDMIHPLLPGRVIHPKAGKTGAYLASGWELKPKTPTEEPSADTGHAEAPEPAPVETEASEPRKRRSAATDKKEA